MILYVYQISLVDTNITIDYSKFIDIKWDKGFPILNFSIHSR